MTPMDLIQIDKEFRALMRMACEIHPDQFTAACAAIRAYKKLTGVDVMDLLNIKEITRAPDGKASFLLKPAN